MWHGAESEYDDYRTVAQQSDGDRKLETIKISSVSANTSNARFGQAGCREMDSGNSGRLTAAV